MNREPLIVRVPTTLMLMMRGRWAGLTKPQQRFLAGADMCTPPHSRAVRFGWSGVGARGASVRVAARLQELGYVEYVDHGRMEDDDNGDTERPIYAITKWGRDLLRAVGELDEDPGTSPQQSSTEDPT
jgi:hypothetical protein